jgi:hypothetical protein
MAAKSTLVSLGVLRLDRPLARRYETQAADEGRKRKHVWGEDVSSVQEAFAVRAKLFS